MCRATQPWPAHCRASDDFHVPKARCNIGDTIFPNKDFVVSSRRISQSASGCDTSVRLTLWRGNGTRRASLGVPVRCGLRI